MSNRVIKTFFCGCHRRRLGVWDYCHQHRSANELVRLITDSDDYFISRTASMALRNYHMEIFKYDREQQLRKIRIELSVKKD